MAGQLIQLLVYLIVIGVVFWLIIGYVLPAIPMPEPIRMAVIAILALIVIIWLLSAVGLLGAPPHLRTG